ncbi:MAG: nitroreductase family protein [Planctomycetota bacterium]|nr:MAG: nitroreductase family protein [Planctomycetota bacterium]
MDVMQAIKTRRSVRAYSSKPIPTDVMQRMRQALRYAPSACNIQPWHFILVTDSDLRRKVAQASRDQMWMADAPVIVVACAYPEHAYKYMGGYGNSADLDAAIALDHLTLAAVVEGLGTCWIGAFSEPQVKKLLKVPEQVKIVAMTPLGYPAEKNLIHPLEEGKRKSEADIFSIDYYPQHS